MERREHPDTMIESPTLDDYRNAGRQAGEIFLGQHTGNAGAEKFLAVHNRALVDSALASAINQMAASGATPEQTEAWAHGFGEPLAKHAAEIEAGILIDRAVRGMLDPDGLPGRGRGGLQ